MVNFLADKFDYKNTNFRLSIYERLEFFAPIFCRFAIKCPRAQLKN